VAAAKGDTGDDERKEATRHHNSASRARQARDLARELGEELAELSGYADGLGPCSATDNHSKAGSRQAPSPR
jgi:hypothetical protein